MCNRPSYGYSLVELAFVACLVVTVSGIAIPQMLVSLDDMRAIGATRYLSARLYRTRSEAVKRSANVAMAFKPAADDYSFAVYIDGNRNGIRTREIEMGIDRRLGVTERLGDSFPGITFGTIPDLPPVDRAEPAPGSDPIRLGAGGMVTFTALGTATTGSLYIRGRRGAQYVIRVFGQTGKTRVLRFNARTRQWNPL